MVSVASTASSLPSASASATPSKSRLVFGQPVVAIIYVLTPARVLIAMNETVAYAIRASVAAALGVDFELVLISAIVDAVTGVVKTYFAGDGVNIVGNNIDVANIINGAQERLNVPSFTSSPAVARAALVRELGELTATPALSQQVPLPLRLPNSSSSIIRAAAARGGVVFCLSVFTGFVGTVSDARGIALVNAVNALSQTLQNHSESVVVAYLAAAGSSTIMRPVVIIDNSSTSILIAPALRVAVRSPEAREYSSINSISAFNMMMILAVIGAIVAIFLLGGVGVFLRTYAKRLRARRVAPIIAQEELLKPLHDEVPEEEEENVTFDVVEVAAVSAVHRRPPVAMDEEEIVFPSRQVKTFETAPSPPPRDDEEAVTSREAAAPQHSNEVVARALQLRARLPRHGGLEMDHRPRPKRAATATKVWRNSGGAATNMHAELGIGGRRY